MDDEHPYFRMPPEQLKHLLAWDIDRLRIAQRSCRKHVSASYKAGTHADQTACSHTFHRRMATVKTDNTQFHGPSPNYVTSKGLRIFLEEDFPSRKLLVFGLEMRLNEKPRQCGPAGSAVCLKRHFEKLRD